MTIDQTIDLCSPNTSSTQTKAILDSTQFQDAKEVLAKFIIQERKQTNTQQVLAFCSNQRFNRGSQHARNYQRNNFNNNNNRDGYRAHNYNRNGYRQNNRGNFRGRQNNYQQHGNRNGNWRQNNNNIGEMSILRKTATPRCRGQHKRNSKCNSNRRNNSK